MANPAAGFVVVMGEPEMSNLWNSLQQGAQENRLSREDRDLARKLAKAVLHLGANPHHPGLQSHEIDALTSRYGQKVFQSHLENNTPGAGRLFWVYGPRPRHITVVGLEAHPEDAKRGAYGRVALSSLPELDQTKPPSAAKTRKPPKRVN